MLLLVAARPVGLLVDDRVDRHRGLAGLAVADDELSLAAADRGHRVDGLDAGLQWLLHRLPLNDGRRLDLQRATALGGDVAKAVDRLAERVDDPAEEAVTDRHRQDLAGALDDLAFFDARERPEDDGTDLAHVEVERDAERAVGEPQQLVGHRRRQALDAGDAVTGFGNAADLFARRDVGGVRRHETLERVADLLRANRQLCHQSILVASCAGYRMYAA